MARIGLVACVGRKKPRASAARDLYESPLFAKSRRFVEQNCDAWFILSAKYGLVSPSEVIEPYEETLNAKSRQERREWSERVWAQLKGRVALGDRVILLAGERYRGDLIPLLSSHGCEIAVPMEGLGIGRQLQWLAQHLHEPNRGRDVDRLYGSLRKLAVGLGGARLLSSCSGQQDWPRSGVYFFTEPGELRSGTSEPRIVRVGTHGVSRGSKSTLWTRLRTHRGSGGGVGNHRSSVFRLHVGAAISAKFPGLAVVGWGEGQVAAAARLQTEQELERRVSEYIGAMSVLWLAIEDESGPSSDRAYIERNVIGMLVGANGAADAASSAWLGRYSPNERIRESGLWNLDFLTYSYSTDCLDVVDEYVAITCGKRSRPEGPIAPIGWHASEKSRMSRDQLQLFGDESDG